MRDIMACFLLVNFTKESAMHQQTASNDTNSIENIKNLHNTVEIDQELHILKFQSKHLPIRSVNR